MCSVTPEPGLFDLFFSMPRLEDKMNILLMLGSEHKSRISLHEVFRFIDQMSRPDLFHLWKERVQQTSRFVELFLSIGETNLV